MTLSRRARAALRNFLAFWTGRKRYRTPHAVLEAMQDERDARARNDCRKVGEARRQLRHARLDGLSLETYGRHWSPQ